MKIVRSGQVDPLKLITHRFKFGQIVEAYDTFAHAAETKALKVLIEM
jgi:alcohol dehydrogenase